ncbi:MAG: HupE/UreJ family protein [Chitinophagaceae bacterium]
MNGSKFISLLVGIIFFSCKSMLTYAHEMRPAFLQIRETSAGNYDIRWKIPRIGDNVISLSPQFPDWFVLTPGLPAIESGNGALYHYTAASSKDIHGMTFTIAGIEESMVDVLVQVQMLNGEQFSMMLQPAKKIGEIPLKTSAMDTIKGYFLLGVKHIWMGVDHLLFVLALLIITLGSTRKLLITITAFTIAHSITLSLAALGYVGLPGPPVEATIALSIVFLAVEILRAQQGEPTLTSRKPWVVAFTFGLLHGLGFASALSDVGLPQQHIPLALGFFNVGVEAGQIAFVAVILLMIKFFIEQNKWPVWIKKLPAYGIGSLAAFWLIERVLAFWE